jgi:hypothetical protein
VKEPLSEDLCSSALDVDQVKHNCTPARQRFRRLEMTCQASCTQSTLNPPWSLLKHKFEPSKPRILMFPHEDSRDWVLTLELQPCSDFLFFLLEGVTQIRKMASFRFP